MQTSNSDVCVQYVGTNMMTISKIITLIGIAGIVICIMYEKNILKEKR